MFKKYNRRGFIRTGVLISSGLAIAPGIIKVSNLRPAGNPVRLGGPITGNFTDPAGWVRAVRALGYSAAYSPVQVGAPLEIIKAFREEAKRSNLLIAEVGVWNNVFDPDETTRKENIRKNIESLQLADELGARCCVNISGARGEIWDGPYPGNYARETFDMIVENVRQIIDNAKPVNSFYSLEPMPYMLPDSPDSYLELIKAIDRKQFAAHLDPVNMISSPQRYYGNAAFIKECFAKLGPYIKSIHAKDIVILPKLTVHLEERRPGLGELDYAVLLQETSKLKDIPFMLEHLEKQEDYKLAADYVREVGAKSGVSFVQ